MRPATLDTLMAIGVLSAALGAYAVLSPQLPSVSSSKLDQRLEYTRQKTQESKQRFDDLAQNKNLDSGVEGQNPSPVYIRRKVNADGTTDIDFRVRRATGYRIDWDVTTK